MARTRGKSMEELIPPSPVKPRKTKRGSTSGPFKRPRPNTATQNQLEMAPVRHRVVQSETQSHQHHELGSSQEETLPTQSNEPAQTEIQGVKKGRGAACEMEDWGTGKIIHIEFGANWMPINEDGKKFSSQLGILARDGQKVPLTYTSWSGMPPDVLNAIWKDVKDNTDVPDEYKHSCLKVVGNRWRDWKSRVKTQWYDKYETDEERLAITPNQVVRDQWILLVKYWGFPDVKELCETNKLSRAQGGAPHRTGRKSFARIRKEMMDRGEKTDRLTMFMKTRAKKTKNNEGQQVETFDEEAAAIISQFNDYLEERPEDEEDDSFREEVFTKVMGEDTHGRVRMYGTGVTPSQVFGQPSTTSDINEKRTLEDMERNYESKLNDLKSGYESQLGEMKSKYDDMKSKYDDVSSRLDLLMAHVGIQVNSSGTRSDQTPDG